MTVSTPISPVERLHELGGIATRGTLLRSCDRASLERAVAAGDVVRIARGRYALAAVDNARVVAARLGGVLCLSSAALHHGWAVKHVPDRPQVMVSRGARVDRKDRSCRLHYAELGADAVQDGVTTENATLAHCLRRLPFDEALAISDSALRAGFPKSALVELAGTAGGPGSAQMRRVAALASPEPANPFESCLRAISSDVLGLSVEPQVTIREPGLVARPDLVDVRLRIVLEADSFEWHGGRSQLSADARRYNLLVVHGWWVLRFAYEHVMLQPEYVREVLIVMVALAERMKDHPVGTPVAG